MEEVPASDDEEYLPMPAVATLAVESSIASFPQASSVKPLASTGRPRPKPAYKGAPSADTSIIQPFSSETSTSLADRVKRGRRGLATSFKISTPDPITSSEVIEIDDSDDDELELYSKPRKSSKRGSALPSSLSSHNAGDISVLPPSDPFPQSTSTNYPEFDDDDDVSVPPITALMGDTSFNSSSPTTRKKLTIKVPSLFQDNNEDELLFDDTDGLMMPPPLPIGASSSSSVVPESTVATKPAKKSRKKKQDGEVEGEKPAKKPRAKKAAKKDTLAGSEGVVEKPKKTKKGKGKEKEKEPEFKSAEFILDDEDDELVSAPPPVDMFDDGPVLPPPTTGQKPNSVTSIPGSQPDEEELAPLPPVAKKRKRVVVDDDDDDDFLADGGSAEKEKKGKKAKTGNEKKATVKKAKGRTVVSDEEEVDAGVVSVPEDDRMMVDRVPSPLSDLEDDMPPKKKPKLAKKGPSKRMVAVSESEGEGEDQEIRKDITTSTKAQIENSKPAASSPKQSKNNGAGTPKPPALPSIASRYSIAPRTKSTPLSELIRKVNSQPGSPFPNVGGVAAASPKTPMYSPHAKFSRRALSRIAPLHPNRRTPPPPLPPPPPKPKTKKEKEREEKWEEEMIEDVGGWDEWKNLSDEQQKALRRQKWDRELGGYDD
ncbi:hypothetical protein FB45DRAFT_10252 [Roridomyces roridus]|uniref:Uncharacterized protein n=1 Tax=Roridomyces roridus TaxID=1738132 RepID=A0AAD7CIZ7_9AGAR|nr:hypothetical protein FB45DRAFT_10252 [Roridomyces roridus]